jgi:hypothetical protein
MEGSLKQGDCDFQASQDYIMRTYLKNKTTKSAEILSRDNALDTAPNCTQWKHSCAYQWGRDLVKMQTPDQQIWDRA